MRSVCIKTLWRAAALFAALSYPVYALQIEVGDSWMHVLAMHGKPSREILTDNGSLAFYGSLLVGVENGTVRFLSRGEVVPEQPASGKDEAGVNAPTAPAARAVLLKAEGQSRRRTWIEEAQERQARVLAERLRRCLAFEVYGQMLSRVSWQEYYCGRHHSYSGCNTLERYLRPSNARTADVGDGLTLVDLRDSQSARIEGHGTEVPMQDRYVALQQSMQFAAD